MIDWQITAKTIYCDSVNGEVTIIVKKDWSVQCTGYTINNNKNNSKKKKTLCRWPECTRVLQYKEFLMQEEKAK